MFFLFFFFSLLKFKTRKRHNALFFLPPAQAQHASAVQWCPFAYSLADSVQNNLGIVTDVIRRMIKQGFFFFLATLAPSPSLLAVGVSPMPLTDFKCLLQRVSGC